VLKVLGHGLVVLLLTVATQVGGLAWLAALLLRRAFAPRRPFRGPLLLLLFLLCYVAASFAAEALAERNGRIALPCGASEGRHLVVASPLYCLLNRHYVSTETYFLVDGLAREMDERFPGTLTQALDAGFPLLDDFPLLPHLSHDDGRKVDLAFYYRDPSGSYQRGLLASPFGYWGFAPPRPGEPLPCAGDDAFLTLRWDMEWLRPFLRTGAPLDEERTRAALQWLVAEGDSGGRLNRILLEPHLKSRFGLASDRIRFQGCRAARHDDHIHIESRY
jgi:hypothetical protein